MSGSFRIPSVDFDEVRIGMEEDEVRASVGNPASVYPTDELDPEIDDSYYWRYPPADIEFDLETKRVVSIQFKASQISTPSGPVTRDVIVERYFAPDLMGECEVDGKRQVWEYHFGLENEPDHQAIYDEGGALVRFCIVDPAARPSK